MDSTPNRFQNLKKTFVKFLLTSAILSSSEFFSQNLYSPQRGNNGTKARENRGKTRILAVFNRPLPLAVI
jgi:hypothetical protein